MRHLEKNGLGQMLALAKYYYPQREIDEECLADATWLSNHQVNQQKIAIADIMSKMFAKK